MAQIILPEGAAPATPASGNSVIYPKADGLWYSKNDAGTESIMSGAALAGSTTQAFSVAAATAAAHAVRADQVTTDYSNFPIYTPPTTYATTLSAGSGTFTSAVATMKIAKLGKMRFVIYAISITTNGTAAGYIKLTLPEAADMTSVGASKERAATGVSVVCKIDAGVSFIDISKYDNTYPGGTGYVIDGQITYFVA